MAKYRIELSNRAFRVLEWMARHEKAIYERVIRAIDGLETEPFLGKLLKGELKGLYSLRVGSYRIIYEVHQHKLIIRIIDIGHRKDIYR